MSLTTHAAVETEQPEIPVEILRPRLTGSVHVPGDPRYDFKTFYAFARERGFILYPGKLTQVETFRVGCIGAIGPNEMEQAVQAVARALEDMGIGSGEPAI